MLLERVVLNNEEMAVEKEELLSELEEARLGCGKEKDGLRKIMHAHKKFEEMDQGNIRVLLRIWLRSWQEVIQRSQVTAAEASLARHGDFSVREYRELQERIEQLQDLNTAARIGWVQREEEWRSSEQDLQLAAASLPGSSLNRPELQRLQ